MPSLADKIFSAIKPGAEAEKERAKKIATMGQSEGWAEFVKRAEAMIASHTPSVSQFTPEGATLIAGQVAFVTGIKKCLGIMAEARETAGPQEIDE